LQPFLTEAPYEVFRQLGIKDKKQQEWDQVYKFGIIPAGTKVEKGNPLFPRLDVKIEVEAIKNMMQKTSAPKKEKKEAKETSSDEISFDEFMKIDMRVAEIVKAEKVKKAYTLLKLKLELGKDKRHVVSGSAKYYQHEDLVGRQVRCLSNLIPVKPRGELPEGMVLAGEDEEGTP